MLSKRVRAESARHKAAIFLGTMLYCLSAYAIVAPHDAFADNCPAKVEADTKSDKWAYQPRPGRCEGRYGQLVGTTAELALRSLTANFPDLEPTQSSTWTISWSSRIDGPVTVQATSLLYREYFRMDALVPAGSRSFAWPTDVLVGLAVKRRNIGVLAFTREMLLGRQEPIFLPVSLAAQVAGSWPTSLLAEVVPTRELDELYVSVFALDTEKGELIVISPKHPLQLGFYPEHRAIKVSLSTPAEWRRIFVQLIGQEKSGRGIPMSFWISNEPPD